MVRQQHPFLLAHAQQHFRHRRRLGLGESDDALRVKLELVLLQRLDQALYRLFPIGDFDSQPLDERSLLFGDLTLGRHQHVVHVLDGKLCVTYFLG